MTDDGSALASQAASTARLSTESHLEHAWTRVPLRDRAFPGRENQLAVIRDARKVAEDWRASAVVPGPAANPPEPDELHAACVLGQHFLRWWRQVLGPDHPDTLASAATLAVVLGAAGELQAARDLNEDTFERLRRVLGPNHPDTLALAHALAADRSLLGDFDASRELYQDTYARLRTLRAARSRPPFICGTSFFLGAECDG